LCPNIPPAHRLLLLLLLLPCFQSLLLRQQHSTQDAQCALLESQGRLCVCVCVCGWGGVRQAAAQQMDGRFGAG
jgi:hypothetical protein